MMAASIADSLQHYMKFLNMGMVNLEPSTGSGEILGRRNKP